MRIQTEITSILQRLRADGREHEVVEFKEAKKLRMRFKKLRKKGESKSMRIEHGF